LKLALAHCPSPAHLARFNPTGLDLCRSNRPSPSPHSHPSPPRAPLANPNRHRHRLAIPAASDDFRRRHLGQTVCFNTMYPLLQLDLAATSSLRRSLAISGSRSADSGRLRARCFVEASRGAKVRFCGGYGGHAAPVEASMVGCSRCCHGEVVPRPRLVGRASSASPCQPGKHLGYW
jgi:hypothetical protein